VAEERSAVISGEIERHERRVKKLTDNQAWLVQLACRNLVTDQVQAREQSVWSSRSGEKTRSSKRNSK
jgi:hypothetical protein